MLSQEEKVKLIQNTWLRFNSNIGALFALFENLTSSADEIDKVQIKKIANELAFIFKGKSELAEKDIKQFIASVDDLDVYPDFRKDESVKEIVLAFQDQEIKDAMLEWEAKKPYRSERFKSLFSSVFNNPPIRWCSTVYLKVLSSKNRRTFQDRFGLAHLLDSNHTAKFWDIIAAQVPKYEKHKKWLKDFGYLLEEDL